MYLKQGYRLHNDKYQLLNFLGEGGFSLTYRGAWKTEVKGDIGKVSAFIPVCIKEFFFKDYCNRNSHTGFIETNSETGKEIFNKNKEKIIKEARILSEIIHPNVVNVLEVFKQNNTVYIVMEFISGHSIKYDVEHNGIYSDEKLKKIIYKVGQALDYIHEKNILHLDIKPSNILMDQSNNPKLIDFGISKKYDLSNDQETSTALLAASKGYASIEQYDSEGIQVFSPRPDIYSLGATMYFMITGQVPTESILRSTKGLQNPRELNPAISENTEKVILKAMALNAADRYQSVMEMLLDLEFDPDKDKIDMSLSILPDYPEIASDMNDEPYDFDAEDETIIHTSGIGSTKKERKLGWLFFVIPMLVSGIMALILFGDFWKTLPVDDPPDIISVINPTDTVNNIPENTTEIVPEDIIKPNTTSTTNVNQTIAQKETDEEKHNALVEDAIKAFNQKELSVSIELLDKAELYMKTEVTERYRNLIEQEIEKIEIENRRNNYTFIRKFGNFDVATSNSNQMIGGINDKGIEIIPFKYKRINFWGNDILFQRDDGLYDRYNPSGNPVGEYGINVSDLEE